MSGVIPSASGFLLPTLYHRVTETRGDNSKYLHILTLYKTAYLWFVPCLSLCMLHGHGFICPLLSARKLRDQCNIIDYFGWLHYCTVLIDSHSIDYRPKSVIFQVTQFCFTAAETDSKGHPQTADTENSK